MKQPPRRTKHFLPGSAFAFLLLFSCAQLMRAQYDPPVRSFVQDEVRNSDPIQILGFRVKGRVVKPGTEFQADEEAWLKDSTVIVKNVSSLEIMGIWINLFFPDIDDGKAMAGDRIQIGNRASSETHTLKGRPLHDNDYPPFSLRPGQTFEMPLGTNYDAAEAHRQYMKPGVTPARCLVRFATVYFRNGMKWNPDYFARPDPAHPGKFIEMTPLEFWATKQ